MKLSDKYRFDQLMQERKRLRTGLAAALGDQDIKVTIEGSEAQGDVRGACLAAIRDLYKAELETNGLKLKELGVEADDGDVEPARPREYGMVACR